MKHPIVNTQVMRASVLIGICVSPINVSANETLFQSEKLMPDELVTQVLQRHPNIRIRQAELKASLARIPQESALADPMFSYSMAPETRHERDQEFGHKWMLSQKLPWPGKRDLAAKAQTFESGAAKQQIGNEQLQLTLKARQAYADWYFVYAEQDINERSKALWREFQHLAELHYATGSTSKQDVLKAEVEYYRLQHRDISLERKRKAARSQINVLLNRAPAADVPPPAGLMELDDHVPPVEALMESAVVSRPEILIIEDKIRAARSRIKLTDLEDYPDFKLMAGWNSLWNDEEKRWTIGVSINLPIDSVKRSAAKGESKAKLVRLNTDREQLHNQIQAEVQNAYDALVEARHVLKLYQEKLLPVAKENLAASQRDYESGTGDFLSLISAENNLFQTELGSENAKAELYRSIAELHKAAVVNQAYRGERSKQTRILSSITELNVAGGAQ